MKNTTEVEAATKRLKKIEGQVRGIMKMIEDDKPCEDILIQIGSAKAALHKTGQIILEWHLQHCVLNGIRDGKGEDIIKKLLPAVEQFSRII
jgi:DNA-binding FrmR family transcriptional regulator